MTLKKPGPCVFGIQDHVDVIIPRGPGITQQLASDTLKLLRCIVTQKIQRFTQRLAPHLIPTRLAPGVTATIARPPCNSMHTTPRRALTIRSIIDLDCRLGRMMIEILRVVREPNTRRARL